ncbi:hypothetical protein KRR26_31575 [Corallococcus sp. M34]|uniref:hypothetical protein n=1 Tax=Citreicoccus inhibens TaxID=2849499 RepID=UPI001C21E963|nr:hypothetical protein [Citreicoccus inhibens]MBU8900156.1 hypothetical protein [Citreicoccus inhibens]
MKKLLFVGALALGAAACDPEVAQDPAPEAVGLAEFNPAASPAIVPSPNDLAIDQKTGLVNAPIDPKAPAAQQEFTRDYLNTLNGFPPTAIANTKVANLDPFSVNANTVKIIDLYKGTELETAAIDPLIGYNPDTGYINIIPQDAKTKANAWPKGGRYAVALIGGDHGLKTLDGKNVIASSTWAFVSSPKPLVTCEDLTSPDCGPATEIIPSTKTDPAEKLADQTASALKLEQIRRAYAKPIGALVAQGVKREDIVLLWTFTITNQPEATFDPTASIIPFPNDLVRTPADPKTGAPAHLNLPVPPGTGLQSQLVQGLNTLDGFSTTSPLISENSDTKGAIDLGALDEGTLKDNVMVLKLTNTDKGSNPKVTPCINCASSKPASGTSTAPQQLQLVPQVPLDEATQYGAVLTTGLKNTLGRRVAPAGAFALMRLANPVYVNGKSQVNGIPDESAKAVEPLRQAFKPLFDNLEKAGIKRSQIALAWTFTTQSINSVAQQLHTLPASIPPAQLPNVPLALQLAPNPPAGLTARLYAGELILPNLLTDPRGTFNPDPSKLRGEFAPFYLSLPPAGAAMPANGWPVVIFAHGLTGNRESMKALAGSLGAAGYASIAIDAPFHGDRASCIGFTVPGTTTPAPDYACADPATQKCDTSGSYATNPSYGRCIARTQSDVCDPTPGVGDMMCSGANKGRCIAQRDNTGAVTGGLCEGGTFNPAISGWNFLDTVNLFATRDHFRQHIIDMGQVIRILQATSPGNINQRVTALTGAEKLDGSQIHFVGQSLGGIMGTMSTASSPNIQHAVLNVAGGDLVNILMTSPSFDSVKTSFIGLLHGQGIDPGTPAFDQFIVLANTILDPADARNYAYALRNAPNAHANRAVLVQTIKGDMTIPNEASLALVNAANRTDNTRTVASYMFDPANYSDIPANSQTKYHGFLLRPDLGSITVKAQTQVIGFLNTGTVAAPQ